MAVIRNFLRAQSGVTAVEFGLVGPVMLLILLGMFACGITISNYVILSAAAQQGAQMLALSRGTTTAYNSTITAIKNSTYNLAWANVGTTLTVNGSGCTLLSCTIAQNAAGQAALVTLTYPCNMVIYGHNYVTGTCQLSVQGAAVVQ